MSDRRAELLAEYKELYLKVEAILFRADPIDINYGHNSDEYSPEVGTILPRLKTASSADDVLNIVHEEFSRWFGVEEVGPKSRFDKIANEDGGFGLKVGSRNQRHRILAGNSVASMKRSGIEESP